MPRVDLPGFRTRRRAPEDEPARDDARGGDLTPGGPEVLRPVEAPRSAARAWADPSAAGHAGVNRPDALQRAGSYAPPPGASPLPGLEAAGHVAAVGPGVTGWREGDAVCALLPGAGTPSSPSLPAAHALPVPRGMELREAACLPETFFTVWTNVFQRGGLKAGEVFLVHGGSSGIGTTAIQLARVPSARGSSRRRARTRNARPARASAPSARSTTASEDFVAVLRAEGGADLILDMVGGSYLPRNVKALRDDGRLVQIAFLEGRRSS
jgi:NADPH:quinone reductase